MSFPNKVGTYVFEGSLNNETPKKYVIQVHLNGLCTTGYGWENVSKLQRTAKGIYRQATRQDEFKSWDRGKPCEKWANTLTKKKE